MKKLFLLLLVIPLAGAGCWSGDDSQTSVDIYGNPTAATNTNAVATDNTNSNPSTIVLEGNNVLLVSKQQAGTSAIIDFVALEKPGFIAIHADNNGKPGTVLATSSLLGAGSHTKISVALATQANKTYFAMLHLDNGDGTFSETADPVAKDSHDADVTASFQVVTVVVINPGVNINLNTNGSVVVNTNTGIKVNQTLTVNIQNYAFSAATLTVHKGDKVTFTNKDSVAHSAVDDNGAFNSGLLSQKSSYTLNTAALAAGTYTYHCGPHPNMKATLIVQ